MEKTKNGENVLVQEKEEANADIEIWNYIFGFVPMAVVKCAIELKIADVLEAQDIPMTLADLSTAIGCKPSLLHRIMRFLVPRGIFKETTSTLGSKGYLNTPQSRKLVREYDKSMAAFVLLESNPTMLGPFCSLSRRVLASDGAPPFEAANGEDVWSHAASDLSFSKLINDAMACDAKASIPALVSSCPNLLEEVGSLVDVGGGNGTTLRILVKAFPWIRGINFDLPHVISEAPKGDGIEHVEGNMFESVPKADAAFLKYVLHDWGDDDSIRILKKCKEAVPEDKGKVIIFDIVIAEENECQKEDKLTGVRLMLDMVMLAHTNSGKERTLAEWDYIIKEAGFSRYTVKNIQAVQSVIVAFP